MAEVTNEEKMVLTNAGLETLVTEILNVVNERIQARIVTAVDGDSDSDHVPSAATVYSAVSGVTTMKNVIVSDGDITKANITPDTKTLYLVRKSATATDAIPYVYFTDVGYVAVCGVTTIEATESPAVMTDEAIKSAVASAATSTDPKI